MDRYVHSAWCSELFQYKRPLHAASACQTFPWSTHIHTSTPDTRNSKTTESFPNLQKGEEINIEMRGAQLCNTYLRKFFYFR
jgi:hypothetical protein